MARLTLEEARSLLKARKLRSTAPRLAVLQAISAQTRPISHSQLLKRLPLGEFDGATVYRNLTRLSEQGLLRIVSRAGGMARYELTPGQEAAAHSHPHFVCSECDTVSCLPIESLPVPQVDGPWNAALAGATLQLQGRCPDCLEASA